MSQENGKLVENSHFIFCHIGGGLDWCQRLKGNLFRTSSNLPKDIRNRKNIS